MRFSLSAEEVCHDCPAFLSKYAGYDFRLGMQQGRGEEGEAPFGVDGSVDDFPDLRPGQGTSAHRAWLHCDIECAFVEVFATHGFRGGGDGYHFGMGCRVVQPFGHVVPLGYYSSPAHYDGTHRHFIFFGCGLRLTQRLSHVFLIFFHCRSDQESFWES